jgi:aromatic ring-opening dioxygenase LigB subunit
MPLVFGCIAPHGDIIPGSPGAEQSAATTAAMRAMGQRLATQEPDVVVVITPHGMRVDGAMAVSLSERAAGGLEESLFVGGEAQRIQLDLAVDQPLARAILANANAADVPVAALHYGATSGPHDCYPLDWGAVVPLWFLGAQFARQPRVVLVVPSRALPLDALQRFGHAVASAAAATESRVALVASSDLAHAHAESGPYGFHPAAAQFDQAVVTAVKAGDLARLAATDGMLVRDACPDGLWQILVLAGALGHTPLQGEFLSYERPTYYGMLTAAYTVAAV